MRGMKRIADQHDLPVRPILAPEPGKIAPERFVGDERVPVQSLCEKRFAETARRLLIHRIKPGACPGRMITFDDEGAHAGLVTVVMRVEGAVFSLG